jgi:hypothetical protein
LTEIIGGVGSRMQQMLEDAQGQSGDRLDLQEVCLPAGFRISRNGLEAFLAHETYVLVDPEDFGAIQERK